MVESVLQAIRTIHLLVSDSSTSLRHCLIERRRSASNGVAKRWMRSWMKSSTLLGLLGSSSSARWSSGLLPSMFQCLTLDIPLVNLLAKRPFAQARQWASDPYPRMSCATISIAVSSVGLWPGLSVRSEDCLCGGYQSIASPRMAIALATDPNRLPASPEVDERIRKMESTSLAGGRGRRNALPWLMQHPGLSGCWMSM